MPSLEELAQALIRAAQGTAGGAQVPLTAATPAEQQAAEQTKHFSPLTPAPAPFTGGTDAPGRRGVPDWQAAADVLIRAASAKRRKGAPLGGALLVGQDTRAGGPADLIAPQLGAGNAQQTFQRGGTRYHVFFDDEGKRHVRAFQASTRRRLMR
jgi:hypothetical protein